MTEIHSDTRLCAIESWLAHDLGMTDFNLAPASSDASFRRYFRVCSGTDSWIVMDAPPDKEDVAPFISIARFLEHQGLHVPKILAQEESQGFLLLSDLGQQAYLDILKAQPGNAASLYSDAIASLVELQSISPCDITLPRYDRTLLLQELNLFPEWFLQRHLTLSAPGFLKPVFDLLIESALNQPQVIVHRDYHSRNLMVCPGTNPGIIDFQDAVIGPISYDLVSLFRDCYIAWPQEQVTAWVEQYFDLAQQKGLLSGYSLTSFLKWFDYMGLQRHLKVLGIFCRLYYRDNKANYLADLPQTLAYVLEVSQRYHELAPLYEYLSSTSEVQSLL